MSDVDDSAPPSAHDVFKTTYNCENCGNVWSHTHAARTTVEKSTSFQRVVAYDNDCDEFVTSDCACCRQIVCPVCRMGDAVSVADRSPIEDGDSE